MKNFILIFIAFFITVSANVFSQTWSLTGNAGTTNSNFVGTTDNRPLLLKVNNQWAGSTGFTDNYNVSFGYSSLNPLNAGGNNTAFGAQALRANTSGVGNVAVGVWTLDYNTIGANNVAVGFGASSRQVNVASYNVAIGSMALQNNAKDGNTAVGFEAGLNNTNGENLTAVGFKTLWSNTTGVQNTAVGFNALINNTTGYNNTAIGAWTLVSNTTGEHNTTVGMKSLYSNTTGEYNTAVGVQALEKNTTGYWNAAMGSGALNQNTTGFRNTSGGNSSMWFNTTGYENTAFGEQALGGSLDGSYNTAVGCRALWSINQTPAGDVGYGHGNNNTAVGFEALRDITNGSNNVAMGMHALRINSSGMRNVGIGHSALMVSTTGNDNIAIGYNALSSNTTGNSNIAIGYGAGPNAGAYNNTTAIGYGTLTTASNQVRIGNNAVISVGGYMGWSNIADASVQKNIKADVPGLDFINQLQPVTYNLDLGATPAQQRLYTGFSAQEVEKVAKSIDYDFSGIDVDEGGIYSLRYAEFTVPLVKAVQELSAQNETLLKEVAALKELVNGLLSTSHSAPSGMYNTASVQQNFPNPFNQITTIHYVLPPSFRSAQIVVTGTSGNVVKQLPLSGYGTGSVTIEADYLRPGIYLYSLYVDGSLIDTKRMIVTE